MVTVWREYVNCTILYKADCLRLNICACYSWEMALNVGLEVSFDNMKDWKGIRQKYKEVYSTKSWTTSDETSH
jgi:hypothetical protein